MQHEPTEHDRQESRPYHGVMPPRNQWPGQKPPQAQIRPEVGHAFRSSKTYTHSVGLSCCFRQWRAPSHCQFLHGYAIKVDIDFLSRELDERNWVQDFGGMKEIKKWLEDTFDHKTLVARDDPKISIFRELQLAKMVQLVEVESIGVEAFSYMIFDHVRRWLMVQQMDQGPVDRHRVRVERVTVSEHEGNRASYGYE